MDKRPEHPCKQDCPRRTATCRSSCPDWASYVKIRDANYEARKTDPERLYSDYIFALKKEIKKRLRHPRKK